MPKLTAKIERNFKIPNDPDKAELKIKHLKPGEIQRIEAEYTNWTGKASKDESFTTELNFDPTMQARALRIASVVGWKGFRGLDDEVLECTRKNVGLYLDDDPILGDGDDAKKLSEWIDYYRKLLADEMKVVEEEAPKN